MRAPTRRRGLAARAAAPLAALALAVPLGGCGGGGDDTALSPELEALRPTGSPAVPVEHDPNGPLEFRKVTGDHFTMKVPGGWEERTAKGTKDAPATWAYRPKQSSPRSPLGLGVVVDDKAGADVLQQSHALELAKRVEDVEDFTRSEVAWPGTQRTIVCEWTESTAGKSPVRRRYRQVMAQVRPGLIVNAVAVGSPADFPTSDLTRALATFTPG